jgi:hypothetical protein
MSSPSATWPPHSVRVYMVGEGGTQHAARRDVDGRGQYSHNLLERLRIRVCQSWQHWTTSAFWRGYPGHQLGCC